ncbi:hypothetical protein BDN72DRAFT_861424 [Pluteus cervinus]|uniref:Uncharacterized protein n=1 Tax=Pluteus cervinus TaxID=181527 RepID=A0ACD3AFP9_9AGAR|nr:hypothetical protein BDN72DRAFT_861424 [Pluteus cervinus]
MASGNNQIQTEQSLNVKDSTVLDMTALVFTPTRYSAPGDLTQGLPVECITEIFLCKRDGSPYGKRSLVVLTLSWVCKRWRSIALQDSRLWSVIDVTHMPAVEACLSRSAQTPLSLFLSPFQPYNSFPSLLSLASRVIHRTQSLVIGPGDPIRVLGILHGSEAKLLTVLDIASSSLHEELFIRGPPPLKRLRLTICNFSWTSWIFPATLVVLHILRPGTRINVEGFLGIVKEMPFLAQFLLFDVLKPSWETDGLECALPSVTKVEMVEPRCSPITQMFQTCSLVEASIIACNVTNLQDAHGLLRSILQSMGEFTPRSLRVYLAYDETYADSTLVMTGPPKKVTLSIGHGDRVGLLFHPLNLLPLQNLHSLVIAFVIARMDTEWIDIIGFLPELKSLVLGNAAALDFIQCLPLGSNQFRAIERLEFNLEIVYEHEIVEVEADWEGVQDSLIMMELKEVCFTGEIWEDIAVVDWEMLKETGCSVMHKGWMELDVISTAEEG